MLNIYNVQVTQLWGMGNVQWNFDVTKGQGTGKISSL